MSHGPVPAAPASAVLLEPEELLEPVLLLARELLEALPEPELPFAPELLDAPPVAELPFDADVFVPAAVLDPEKPLEP